jgi:hypothetical protein
MAQRKPVNKKPKSHVELLSEDLLIVRNTPDSRATLDLMDQGLKRLMELTGCDTIQLVATRQIPHTNGEVTVFSIGNGNTLARKSAVESWLQGLDNISQNNQEEPEDM